MERLVSTGRDGELWEDSRDSSRRRD